MSDLVPDPLDESDEYVVINVTFGDGGVEVDFLDPRRQADGIMEITKLGADRHKFLDSIEILEEHVRDLIDDVLRERRD